MSIAFGLIMFLCVVGAALIFFTQLYSKNWKEKKLVLGVKNRDEFREGTTAGTVDAIVKKRHRQASVILAAVFALAVILLFLCRIVTIWAALLFLTVFLMEIPYVLGNREMKDLKRRLGLGAEAGVSYVDLNSAGAVHALKPIRLLIPTLVGLVFVVLALLIDFQVLLPGKVPAAGMFVLTSCMAMFWLVSITIFIIARVADNLKNEVISADSTINANYNRAKKKNTTDLLTAFAWGNTAFLAATVFVFAFFYTNAGIIAAIAAYLVAVFVAVALFVRKSKMIDARYEKEMKLLSDDDDHWIFGLFYCNPGDSRMSVERRAGVGMDINLGHPVGKVVGGFLGLILIGVLVLIVWMGMVESTPLTIRAENGTVICRHMQDEYVIDSADIRSTELGEDVKKLSLVRNYGYGTVTVQKGNFTVDGKSGCTVFLSLETGNYIKIVTDENTYYINGASEEETEAVYNMIAK